MNHPVTAFATLLILTIGLSSDAYPLLPRHLSIAASLTIGIPTFFLALAPSTGPWRPDGFVRTVARFAVPAGVLTGTGVVAGYLFALHDLDLSVPDARTVALTTLIACGLYLMMALEAGGSRRRSTLVAGMCAVMGALYVAALTIPGTRAFFALTIPHARHARYLPGRERGLDRRALGIGLFAAREPRSAAFPTRQHSAGHARTGRGREGRGRSKACTGWAVGFRGRCR